MGRKSEMSIERRIRYWLIYTGANGGSVASSSRRCMSGCGRLDPFGADPSASPVQ